MEFQREGSWFRADHAMPQHAVGCVTKENPRALRELGVANRLLLRQPLAHVAINRKVSTLSSFRVGGFEHDHALVEIDLGPYDVLQLAFAGRYVIAAHKQRFERDR